MAKKLAIFFLLFLLVIVQVSFLPNIFAQNSIPNILLVMLIFWTARKGIKKTWKLAILGGLIMDLFLFSPVGLSSFSFLATMILVNYLAKRFLVTHLAWRFAILAVLMAIGTLSNEIILVIIAKTLGIIQENTRNIPASLDASLFYTMASSVVVFTIFYWPLKKIEAVFNLYGSRTNPKSNVR
jgi:rod shape-determining protein MreD